MVWDGTGTLEITSKNSAKFTFDTLDADNEESFTLFPIRLAQLGFIPAFAKIISTHANAITYDLAFQGSIDETNWNDIVSNTAKDTVVSTSVAFDSSTGDPSPASFNAYRVLLVDNTTTTTPGAGGHSATVWVWR